MDSFTDISAPGLPALSTSNTTTPTTQSEAPTPKHSPKLEPVESPATEDSKLLENLKIATKAESKTENNEQTPVSEFTLPRPTFPHANTATVFEKAREVQRMERKWRGIYDRNRAANPGAARGL